MNRSRRTRSPHWCKEFVLDWIRTHRREIASTPNVAMFLFLQDCNEIRPEPVFVRFSFIA